MNSICSFRLCTLTDKELTILIDKLTDQMFTNQEIPTRHIPARPDKDYDLLVGELIIRFNQLKEKEEERKTLFKENDTAP